MLDGHIDIVKDLGLVPDDPDQLRGDLLGIAVEQADPADLPDLRQLTQELRQHLFSIEVRAVDRCLLGDQDQLPHALTRQFPGRPEDLLHGKAAVGASDGRDHTVGAVLAAALGDPQIPVAVGRRQDPSGIFTRLLFQVRQADQDMAVGLLPVSRLFFPASKNRLQGLDQTLLGCRPDDRIDLGDLAPDLLAVALGQTACDDQGPELPGGAAVRQLQDALDALFLGVIDKAAGIDDGGLGQVLVIRDLMPRRRQVSQHFLGVDQVFVTSQ